MNRATPSESSRTAGADPLARLTDSQRADLARAKRAAFWVGVVLPLALVAIATIVTALWVPRMPDPMAVHWGGSTEPDGFGPPWSGVVMALGIGLFVTALSGLQVLQRWQSRQRGTAIWSASYRFLPAVVLGTVTMVETLAVGTAWQQLDADDAAETGPTVWILLTGFVLWILVTVAAYFAQPRLRIDAPDAAPSAPLVLSPNERVVWVGAVKPSRGFVWSMFVAVVLLAACALWAFSVEPVAGWITTATLVFVVILMLTSTWFNVRIDHGGLEARAPLGWPVFRLRPDEIVSVTASQISPFGEYGGWGMRWTPDRFGLVMRTGVGIVVTRRNGRLFALTVDDAQAGAALLAAVAQGYVAKTHTADEPGAEGRSEHE